MAKVAAIGHGEVDLLCTIPPIGDAEFGGRQSGKLLLNG
jgi:hypothetical protein